MSQENTLTGFLIVLFDILNYRLQKQKIEKDEDFSKTNEYFRFEIYQILFCFSGTEIST